MSGRPPFKQAPGHGRASMNTMVQQHAKPLTDNALWRRRRARKRHGNPRHVMQVVQPRHTTRVRPKYRIDLLRNTPRIDRPNGELSSGSGDWECPWRAVDDPAADHPSAMIEHQGLARAERRYRLAEGQLQAVA